MTKKEYLGQACMIDKVIRSKELQIDAIRSHAEYLTPQIPDAPVKSQAEKSRVADAAVRIVKLQEEICDEIVKLEEKRKEISQAISSVNNLEYETLLNLRYLEYLEWPEIAFCMGMNLRSIYKAHGRALELVKIP